MSRSLDSLQSMVNATLIEIGKALRGADKEAGGTFAGADARLRVTIPDIMENFQQALDDFETDIVRAKAVLLRDLEELQASRKAAENPPEQIVEPVKEPTPDIQAPMEPAVMETSNPSPPVIIKEEKGITTETPAEIQDTAKELISKIPDPPKEGQVPSPPSSNEAKVKSEANNPDTTSAVPTPPTATTTLEDPSIDSLFEMTSNTPDNDDNPADTTDLNFDSMDFLTDPTTQDTSEPHPEFDLSTFGAPQDFAMADTQPTTDTQTTTAAAAADDDDLFRMINEAGSGDLMDLDSSVRPAEDSAFDEIYFQDDPDLVGGGNDMNTEFDDDFFGI